MGESHRTTENWVETWIEEQRARVRAEQESKGSDAHNEDPMSKWPELGREMLRAFERFFTAGSIGVGPPLGWAREHELAWRELVSAHARYRQLEAELQAKLARVQTDALFLLECKARERADSGRPLASARELYDLWIECGEQSYAQLAHSDAYSRLQAELANATVKLRACQQTVIERALKQFDLPTRAELNNVHRQLHELRERLERFQSPTPSKPNEARGRSTSSTRRKTSNSRRKGRGKTG